MYSNIFSVPCLSILSDVVVLPAKLKLALYPSSHTIFFLLDPYIYHLHFQCCPFNSNMLQKSGNFSKVKFCSTCPWWPIRLLLWWFTLVTAESWALGPCHISETLTSHFVILFACKLCDMTDVCLIYWTQQTNQLTIVEKVEGDYPLITVIMIIMFTHTLKNLTKVITWRNVLLPLRMWENKCLIFLLFWDCFFSCSETIETGFVSVCEEGWEIIDLFVYLAHWRLTQSS